MRVKPIQDIIQKMLYDRKMKLNAEIKDLKIRQTQDMSVYGVGGAYGRKERAIEAREKQLKQLEEFQKSTANVITTEPWVTYHYYCKECNLHFWTARRKPDNKEYLECPLCYHLVFNSPDKCELEVVKSVKPKRQQDIESRREELS